MAKQGGLGRGLGALLKDGPGAAGSGGKASTAAHAVYEAGYRDVPAAKIHAGPFQPRQSFDDEALGELVDSIRERGIMQPLLVRPRGDGYEIIAGERRLRAARKAKLKTVPVRVIELDDQAALEVALIENLQREDLNPLEEAEGYRRLAAEFELTQAEVAERVGRARATVANAIRLLDLPEAVRDALAADRLSSGHAKILLQVADAAACEQLARECMEGRWSVRELEQRVKRRPAPAKRKRPPPSDIPDDHVRRLVDALHRELGTAVRLRPCRTYANGKKARGRIEIDFFSNDELDRLLALLGVADEL